MTHVRYEVYGPTGMVAMLGSYESALVWINRNGGQYYPHMLTIHEIVL